MRQCPAGADDIVQALARIDHAGRTIALVPGLSTENDAMPDVMRGEETQILGALALSRTATAGCSCCPARIPNGPRSAAAGSCRSAPS